VEESYRSSYDSVIQMMRLNLEHISDIFNKLITETSQIYGGSIEAVKFKSSIY
jgi:hypothetical protein